MRRTFTGAGKDRFVRGHIRGQILNGDKTLLGHGRAGLVVSLQGRYHSCGEIIIESVVVDRLS